MWLLENGRSVAKSNQIFVNKDALYISDGGVVEAVAFERALSCGVRHIVNDYTRFVESGIIWSRMEYLEKIEVVRHGKVRRAKLYYIRRLSTKEARLKERRERVTQATAAADVEVLSAVAPEAPATETK